MYFATVSERDWELDVFIRNRIGISAACADIIRMRGLRRPVAAAVVIHGMEGAAGALIDIISSVNFVLIH